MKRASFICCLAATLGGCHSGGSLGEENQSHSIAASEFQQSCAVDSDCVAVYQGTLTCCGGSCPNAAVNQVGYSAYASAVASRTPMCNPEPPCAVTDIYCSSGAICSNGTCQFSPTRTDDAGQRCPFGCPATSAGATVAVTTVPAMAVTGVQATLTGPESGTMSCAPSFDAIVCAWPVGVALTPGAYTLEVSAPGYQTTTVQVELTISPPTCGCTIASIQPSTVVISPVDGG
jgi:hypothetical protein